MRSKEWRVWVALALGAFMLFARLGELPLRDPDEGRNAEVAREMRAAGAWLTPTFNGLTYLDKPSFFFKTVGASMALFGESEWAARLPSACFGFAILLMVAAFCRREYDERTAAMAVAVLATTPLFFALARQVMMDMSLAFFVCAAIFCGFLAEAHEGRTRMRWYFFGAVASTIATLIKGPVGFAIPALAVVLTNIAEKRVGWWKRFFHPLNLLIFVAVIGPWFWLLTRAHPDFAHYALVDESFRRFTTGAFHRSAPFYYYLIIVLGGMFAWSGVLPWAAKSAIRNRARLSRADRMLIIWATLVITFFSVSRSKLPHYILSAFVPLSILTARVFSFALDGAAPAEKAVRRSVATVAAVCAAMTLFLLGAILAPNTIWTAFHIHSREFDSAALGFRTLAVMLGLVTIAALIARVTKSARLTVATFLVFPIALMTFGFSAALRYSNAMSSRNMASQLKELGENSEIASLHAFPAGLPYYLRRNITLVTDEGTELSNYIAYSLSRASKWPEQVIRPNELPAWIDSRTNELCLLARNRAILEEVAVTRYSKIFEVSPNWWGVLIQPGIESRQFTRSAAQASATVARDR